MADRAPTHRLPTFGKQHSPRGQSRDSFYCSDPWRRLRLIVLVNEPLCADPFGLHRKTGHFEPATEVDHVIPRDERPDLALDEGNLQGLCKGCHSRKTRKEHRA